jgi:hypothetical protein
MCIGLLGIKCNNPLESGARILNPPLVGVDTAQIRMREAHSILQLNRFLKQYLCCCVVTSMKRNIA